MNIVLTVTNYKNLTGSEMYVYDVAHELHRLGHTVMILANDIGGELLERTSKEIKVYPFFNHPTFAADLVISSQPSPTGYALTFFPEAKHIQVLHSHLPYEEPVIDKRLKYIAVRPEVKTHWLKKYPNLDVLVVRNGVNTKRFNIKRAEKPLKHTVLFVGTLDHLRREIINDLIKDSVEKNHELLLVLSGDLGKVPKNVSVIKPQWHVEELVKKCTETAGIFIGRTTIEGWMCGKPGLVYDVDDQGHILSKKTISVPENREQFDIEYMTKQLLLTYL